MVYYKTKAFSHYEIVQAVQIQLDEIQQGFLSSLGGKALELIFEHMARSPWGIMVLAVDELTGKVIGYVLGTIDTGRLYREFLLKRFPKAVWFFLPKVLTLDRLVKIFETISYPRKNHDEALPELLDIAVSKEYHGAGVATGLFRSFETVCRGRGVRAFKIPTGESLVRAHRFYEKMGAVRACMFELHRGQRSYVYIYRLD